MITSSYAAPLSVSTTDDVSVFGAKTANLAKAISQGFLVPPGIAITKQCTLDTFSALAKSIVDELGVLLAVRSSAVKEDSAARAFPGMFETVLGVKSPTELIEAFTTVKNSGTAERLRKYQGEVVQPEDIAVLIQRMVNATRAGVAFSRDPSSGESKVIIESNYGLGKSVVDGDVTPDSIECAFDGTCKIIVGRKSTQITLSDSGTREQMTSEADARKCSLSNKEIQVVVDLARKVESALGFPADIEWAIDQNGELWLLPSTCTPQEQMSTKAGTWLA